MNCPECDYPKTRVYDSRPIGTVYRRRKCLACDYRYTTYEITQITLMEFLDEHLPVEFVDQLSDEIDKAFPNDTSRRKLEGYR